MMDSITVGAKIRMTEAVTGGLSCRLNGNDTLYKRNGQCFHRMVEREAVLVFG